jgi:hypothetical protein
MQLGTTLLRRLLRAPYKDCCSQAMPQERKNQPRLNGLHKAKWRAKTSDMM